MKRLLLILPVVVLCLVGGAIAAVNAGLLTAYVTGEIQKATGAKVRLEQIQILLKLPLTLKLGRGAFENAELAAEWTGVRVVLGRWSAPYDLDVTLDEPRLKLKDAAVNEGKSAAAKPAPPGVPTKPVKPVHLKLLVTNGSIDAGRFRVHGLQVRFEQKKLLNSSASFNIQAQAEDQQLKLRLPVVIDAPNVTLTPETIKAEQLNTTVAGLKADLRGGSLLKDDRHRWKIQIVADDLAKIPAPPSFTLAKAWAGALRFNGEVIKEGTGRPWQLDADIDARKVAATVDYSGFGGTVKGRVTVDLKAAFQHHGVALVVPSFSGLIDAPDLDLTYSDWIAAGEKIPVRAEFAGRGDVNGVEFERLQLLFWKFNATLGGKVALTAPFAASVRAELQPMALAGLEKIITPLKASPVQGEVAFKGALDGPLADLTKAHVVVDVLKLKNFSAQADYDSAGAYKIRGPVSGSLEASAEVVSSSAKTAAIRGFLNLKEAALVAGALRKEAGKEFSMQFAVKNAAEKLQIESLELKSFIGNITASGAISNIFDPTVDLRLGFNPLSLTELRMALPPYHDVIPAGQVAGELRVEGHVDTKPEWYDWPLILTGRIRATLPRYQIADKDAASPAGGVGSGAGAGAVADDKAGTSLLPKGRLTAAVNMTVSLQLDSFSNAALELKTVKAEGQVASGKFKGRASVGRVFGGSVDLPSVEIPLLEERPALQGAVVWKNMVIEDLLAFSKPEYKGFATGRTLGSADFQTLMPSDAGFMEGLKVKGKTILAPVTFSTVKIGQTINELIAKVPALKISPAKVEPLKGQMEIHFSLAAQVLQIDKLRGEDTDGSELNLAGKVLLTEMKGDLVGDFHWAKPTLKGCVLEGNADAKGRLTVPLAMRGNLMKPEYSMLNDMAGPLAEKALKCEAGKFLEKAKTQGREKVEEEIKKRLKGLFGK